MHSSFCVLHWCPFNICFHHFRNRQFSALQVAYLLFKWRDLELGVHPQPSIGTYIEGLWPLEFLIPDFVRLYNDVKNASSDNVSCLMYTCPSLIHTSQSIWTDMTSLQNSRSPVSRCLLFISTWINVNVLFLLGKSSLSCRDGLGIMLGTHSTDVN